jgi:hypothetical protein
MPRFSTAVLCTVLLLSTLQNGDSFMVQPRVNTAFPSNTAFDQSPARQEVSLNAKKRTVFADPPVDKAGLVQAFVSITSLFKGFIQSRQQEHHVVGPSTQK